MTPQIKQRIKQIRRGEIPEGYKKTKVGIVPEEWEEGFLGNYIQEYKKLSNDIEKYPVYSSSRQGLIPQSLYFDNREAVETNLGYKIVPNGYVTYRHMSDDDLFHFNVNNTGGEILVSSEYPVFSSTKKSSLGYIIPMLNDTARFRYFCRTQKMGGTRTRLYYKNLCNYKSVFPPLAEQEKIVEILQAQDKLIELQQKKIDELKRLKKGYLSKMFPQKGCNVPEIRFPGFTAPWEQRKLSEMCGTFEYGLNAAAKEFDGKNKYIRITDIDDASREFLLSDLSSPDICLDGMSKYLLSSGDIVFARTGASVGKTYIYRENDGIVYFAGFLIRAKVNQDNDAEFVFQSTLSPSYEKYIRITSQRSGQPGVNAQEYSEYDLFAPSKEEQQRIEHFLRGIDNLITLHQRKCDEEKQKKKALMQLLLTGIVRT